MRILVMGAGALGSVTGGFMARAGHEVHLIGRAPHVSAISEHGLLIEGIWGRHPITCLETHTKIEELSQTEFDLILIAVKSYDTRQAVRLIAPLVSADTWVCSYQNGLGNAEAIAGEIGWERVLGARVIFGARMLEPGRVEVTVIAAPTEVGAYSGSESEAAAREIAEAMNKAGLPTNATDRIQTVLWSKVAYNCALNPLSALLNVPYGTLAENTHTRAIMNDVVHELYRVATAMEIPLAPGTAEEYLDAFYNRMLPPTAAHFASMREDLLQGRRTEIDALNGAITRFGVEKNISCPVNAMLTSLILAREQTGNRT